MRDDKDRRNRFNSKKQYEEEERQRKEELLKQEEERKKLEQQRLEKENEKENAPKHEKTDEELEQEEKDAYAEANNEINEFMAQLNQKIADRNKENNNPLSVHIDISELQEDIYKNGEHNPKIEEPKHEVPSLNKNIG